MRKTSILGEVSYFYQVAVSSFITTTIAIIIASATTTTTSASCTKERPLPAGHVPYPPGRAALTFSVILSLCVTTFFRAYLRSSVTEGKVAWSGWAAATYKRLCPARLWLSTGCVQNSRMRTTVSTAPCGCRGGWRVGVVAVVLRHRFSSDI